MNESEIFLFPYTQPYCICIVDDRKYSLKDGDRSDQAVALVKTLLRCLPRRVVVSAKAQRVAAVESIPTIRNTYTNRPIHKPTGI